jgi:hypothetical protein
MNKHLKIGLSLLVVGAALCGCAVLSKTGTQAPPNALERFLYAPTTNVAVQTNVAYAPIATNVFMDSQGVRETNIIQTPIATNAILVTNYAFPPSAAQAAIVGAGSAVGSLFGVGGLVSTILGGLFGLYGTVRSRQTDATSATLAQIIQTAQKVIESTPQGGALSQAFTSWMMKHQTNAGVIQSVAALVDQAVDPEKAQGAAQGIIALMQQTSQNLVTAPTSVAAAVPMPASPPLVGPLA